MSEIVQVRAVVRLEVLYRVVRRPKESGVPRLTVTRVRTIGAGVDHATSKFSFHEGSAFADKAQVQFICHGDRCGMFCEFIAKSARTGRQGDGIVSVHPVASVSKVRTGVEGPHGSRKPARGSKGSRLSRDPISNSQRPERGSDGYSNPDPPTYYERSCDPQRT